MKDSVKNARNRGSNTHHVVSQTSSPNGQRRYAATQLKTDSGVITDHLESPKYKKFWAPKIQKILGEVKKIWATKEGKKKGCPKKVPDIWAPKTFKKN